MATADQIFNATRAIRQGFDKGIPALKFGEGENALVLCRRRKGEEIEIDNENAVEALTDAVFKRCLKVVGEARSFTYLAVAPFYPDGDDLAVYLEGLDHETLEILPMDAAYQVMQFEAAEARQRRTVLPGI
jgi:hypothetical protein